MHFVVLRGIELTVGRVGDGPTRFESIISKQPKQRSKVIQRSNCFKNAPRPPNLVGRTPDRSAMHCWGQPRSTMGQIAQECFMTTKFGRQNLRPKCSALMGSKLRPCRGKPGSPRGFIAQECPMATKYGRKNPWPSVVQYWMEGHAEVK